MEENKKLSEKLEEVITINARVLVGTLLKRIEVLEKENALTPNLYKALVKEIVYENSRYLKELIRLNLDIGSIQFRKSKPREETSG